MKTYIRKPYPVEAMTLEEAIASINAGTAPWWMTADVINNFFNSDRIFGVNPHSIPRDRIMFMCDGRMTTFQPREAFFNMYEEQKTVVFVEPRSFAYEPQLKLPHPPQ
jgi:hypothetical protein